LSDYLGYTVTQRSATVYIADDDQPTVGIAVTDDYASEPAKAGQFTITRTGLTTVPLNVYLTAGGSAVPGVDYATIPNPVTIPIGASSQTIALTPIDNSIVNLPRTASLTLSPNANYAINPTASSGQIDILDNELPGVTVVATDPNASEPAKTGTFTLYRTQNLSQPLSVYYKLGGAGKAGIDFQALSGQVDFAAGQGSATVQIVPIDDKWYKGTRDVILTISPGFDYMAGSPNVATVLLADDEVQEVRVFASVGETIEGTSSSGEFTFLRTGSPRVPLSVPFTLVGAVNGIDYQTLPTSVVFGPGESSATLKVLPLNDTTPKGTRNVQLSLQPNPAYAINSLYGTAVVKIIDDDLPLVTLSAPNAVANHATTPVHGTFRFTRSATATGGDLKVFYAVHGTATNNWDYSFLNGQTVIPDGKSFVDVDVSPIDDVVAKYTKTVILRVLGSPEYLVGTAYQATVSILDNHPLVYSFEVGKPTASAKVTVSGVPTLPPQIGVPGEIVIKRVGLLPTTPVSMTLTASGGNYPSDTVFEGNVLTLREPAQAGGVPPAVYVFPTGANEVHIPVGWHITAKLGTSLDPSTTGNIFYQVPSLFGANLSAPVLFLGPGHVFSVTTLVNQIPENSSANIFRISRSENATTAVPVDYIISGTAFPSFDHNLPATGTVMFNPTDRYKDINVQALADTRNYEGWETINLTINPTSINTILGSAATAQSFIRDSSQPPTDLPPVDSDFDGLTDAFETANGFDRFVPNDPVTDTDHDGASDIEEQTFGMNPRATYSNGSTVSDGAQVSINKGLIPGSDTVPIKFASASCIKCHQTTLKVGPYELTSMNPRSRASISTDTRLEKVFNVKAGQSYPVQITGSIRADTLSTDPRALYTAEILADNPAQPNFFLNDPNGLLGVDRPTSGIDTKTATLIVPKLELTWLTKPLSGNLEIDDNKDYVTGDFMPGGGKRIWVGAKSPSDVANMRNTLMLKIKTSPPLPGKTVWLKSFDVDDTTPEVYDVDRIIDQSPAGKDNLNDILGTPLSGWFPSAGINSSTMAQQLDANGEALVEFVVGMQPGNNYRVAATVFPINNENLLQVDSPADNYYVSAYTDTIKGGFNGSLSPLLTVWRKLHIEVDSMDAPPTSGPNVNWMQSIIDRVTPQAGNLTTQLRIDPTTEGLLHGGRDAFVPGQISISGIATPFEIEASETTPVLYQGMYVTLLVKGSVPTTALKAACIIQDDDDRYCLAAGVFPPGQTTALPRDQIALTTELVEQTSRAFVYAFIRLTNANSMGLNPRTRVPYSLNNEIGGCGGDFVSSKDVIDSPFFWAHTAVFAYQGKESADGDPDTESYNKGVTLKSSPLCNPGITALYLEQIRESAIGKVDNGASEELFEYQILLWGTLAHELAHAPGGQTPDKDHLEMGLLAEEGVPFSRTSANGPRRMDYTPRDFTPVTIRRLRHATKWSE
jgi:hypothetical protein